MERLIKVTLLITIFLIISALKGSAARAEAQNYNRHLDTEFRYTTVNGQPRLGKGEEHFSFYWSVWRGLDARERLQLQRSAGGALLSRREIRWQLHDCRTGVPLNQNQEIFWFIDQMAFDDSGRVIPMTEAPRLDYRYLNMLTLNSLHLRGLGPYVAPKRERGERSASFRIRKTQAYQSWLQSVSSRGTVGEVLVVAEHELHVGLKEEDQVFFTLDEYRSPDLRNSRAAQLFAPYAPDRWPVFYDERAHKPHALTPPARWHDNSTRISGDRFLLRLEWEWCGPKLLVRGQVPPGGMPSAGPNRPGRPPEQAGAAATVVPIEEIDDLGEYH